MVVIGAIAAGINAVAGGGTLITFPTLLFFQTPPVIANATSTLALVVGTAGSVYGYREHLEAVKRWLWKFLPVTRVADLTKLIVFIGVLVAVGFASRLGLLPRTRPILPGEWAID